MTFVILGSLVRTSRALFALSRTVAPGKKQVIAELVLIFTYRIESFITRVMS